MDVSKELHYFNVLVNFTKVSILVVMDVSKEQFLFVIRDLNFFVSILVVMDVSKEQKEFDSKLDYYMFQSLL